MHGLEALIFDVDGTLAETERDGHRVAFNRAFAEAGMDWYWDVRTYGRLLAVTGGKERMRYYWKTLEPGAASHPWAEETIRQLHRRKNEIYAQIVQTGAVALRPGVRRLLDQAAQRGVRLAIATTTSPENVQTLIRSTLGRDAEDIFECIGAGDVVPAKKPASDIYEWVVNRMGISVQRALVIEDSGTGLKAATGAGLPTVVTTGQYTRGPAYEGAIAVLDGLGDDDVPALGRVHGASWRGIVDLDTLSGWLPRSVRRSPLRLVAQHAGSTTDTPRPQITAAPLI
jgi:HAD superfamily hydrolase (TIGR01509 family)